MLPTMALFLLPLRLIKIFRTEKETMNRRHFLEVCLCSLAITTVKAKGMNGKLPLLAEKPVTFGVISDVHQDIAHDAPERLTAFLKEAERRQVDFIIELGDFCFAKEENRSFVALWNQYSGEKHHVLGNHDMDVCTKEEYMQFIGLEKRYYSFDKGGFHFVVLDPNNLCVDGKYTPYAHGNFYVDITQRDHVDPEQLAWLEADLKATDKHCILFSHECFENTVQNRDKIQQILEEENRRCGFKKVIAAFSGHDHTNYVREIGGISYIQINSASNQWVGEKYACPERFSEEINRRRPSLQYTVPYKDSLFAFVTLGEGRLEMEGRESSFIPPTPQDLHIPDDLFPFPLVPWIKDYAMTF